MNRLMGRKLAEVMTWIILILLIGTGAYVTLYYLFSALLGR